MKCLGIARKICLVAGNADCETKISAFDAALVKAKINDFNLIPVSSILAKNTKIIHGFNEKIEKGSFVPCVLTSISSNKKGDALVSVIGAVKSASGIGFVVELSEKNASVEQIEKRIEKTLQLFAKNRKTKLKGKINFVHAEHKVKKYGCTVAAAVYAF